MMIKIKLMNVITSLDAFILVCLHKFINKKHSFFINLCDNIFFVSLLIHVEI